MSLLTGDAAEAVASYLDNLVKLAMDPAYLLEWRSDYMDPKLVPITWEWFLVGHTDDICCEVLDAKKEREERWRGEHREGWIGGVFRMLWRAVSKCVMFVLVVRYLMGVFSLESRGPDIVWEGEVGVVPNRGRFVVRE